MKNELRDFGLTDNEIKIYLVLLKLGDANPSEIAEKTGFSRPYVYDVLERLLEKQIVSVVHEKNKKKYSAIEPSYLVELAKQKVDNIEKILPELISLKGTSKEEIKVETHKGKYVFKTLLNDIINRGKKNEEVLLYGIEEETLEDLGEFMPIYFDTYFARLKSLGIKERVITKVGGKIIAPTQTTKYKFLPEKTIGNTAFGVYENKVFIFLWGDPNYLISIESKRVADSYRGQFEILWKAAKD